MPKAASFINFRQFGLNAWPVHQRWAKNHKLKRFGAAYLFKRYFSFGFRRGVVTMRRRNVNRCKWLPRLCDISIDANPTYQQEPPYTRRACLLGEVLHGNDVGFPKKCEEDLLPFPSIYELAPQGEPRCQRPRGACSNPSQAVGRHRNHARRRSPGDARTGRPRCVISSMRCEPTNPEAPVTKVIPITNAPYFVALAMPAMLCHCLDDIT